MNKKEKVPNELLALIDTIIVLIINGNEGSGDRDTGRRRRRKRTIQCISGSRYNIVIAKMATDYMTTTTTIIKIASRCG